MDKNSSKLIELSSRISSITKELIAEEKKYSKALSENSSPENLQLIKDQINFLKRKCALYTQAEQMRSKQSF
jgi:predicted secreted protein